MLLESECDGCEARQEARLGAASDHGMMPSRAASPIGVEENAFATDIRRWRPILVPRNVGRESIWWHPVGQWLPWYSYVPLATIRRTKKKLLKRSRIKHGITSAQN